MIVVSNSTPLIHFGTIDKLNILKSIYKSIFITRSVYNEVVIQGIALGKEDAFRVEKKRC